MKLTYTVTTRYTYELNIINGGVLDQNKVPVNIQNHIKKFGIDKTNKDFNNGSLIINHGLLLFDTDDDNLEQDVSIKESINCISISEE